MIFFFYGENSYGLRQTVEQLKQKYVGKTGSDLNLVTMDMAQASLTDFVSTVSTAPLLATSRLIIIKNLNQNKTAAAKIADLIEIVPTSTIVVIEETEVDRRSSYFKTLAKLKNAKEFKKLAPPALQKWVKSMVSQTGGVIDNTIIATLINLVGDNQWQLQNEIIKLVSYNKVITKETIRGLVVPNIEQTIFQLIENIVRKNINMALKIYHNLLLHGANDQQIIALLNWQYRNIALAIDNKGNSKWIKDFEVAPFAATKAAQIATNLNMSDVKRAYGRIVEADFSIKSGQSKPELAIEKLIYELAK